jgi:hypothetical protein
VQVSVAVVALGVLAVSLARVTQRGILSPLRDTMTDLEPGASWIAANAEPDAIVVAENPVPRYLHTRRRTGYFPAAASPDRFVQALLEQGVDYLLVTPPLRPSLDASFSAYTRDVVLPAVALRPTFFELVFSDEAANVRVFRVLAGSVQ